MYRKIIKNDVKKSRLITVTITVFIMLTAMFTSLGAALLINLFGAIDNFMLDAKAPHYMQMHAGEIDPERLQQFAREYQGVEELQIGEFLNIDGADIVVGDQSLANSVQDNGLTTQNADFDYLLDLDNQIIHPRDGEIYVPIYYLREGFAEVGDTLRIGDAAFTVSGFLRDSQMNPVMASSKRFLISENDYRQLRAEGTLEYLISFRFQPGAVNISEFESAYLDTGLEDNGAAATSDLIRMMNGLTDGIMILMLLIVSILILAVAFLCVRFTLIAKVEEEYREIGVLKAIGLRAGEIKGLYMAKYSVIAAAGAVLGFLLSLLLLESLLANIRLYMGQTGRELQGILAGGCGAALVAVIVILYVSRVLRRFRKISAIQAIRFGAPAERMKGSKGFTLAGNRLFSAEVFLGIKDVLARKSLYLIMFFVLVISCFIMIVPQNINNTISDRAFMTNIGVGDSDLRMDVQFVEQVDEKTAEIARILADDPDIEKFGVLTNRQFDMPLPDGSSGKLKVEVGDHGVFPLSYTKGRDPLQENEIALSGLNARELEKDIGDTVVLIVGGQQKSLTVCGIYSDITYGGMTAKAVFPVEDSKILWSKISVKLKDPTLIDAKKAEYKERFTDAKVSKIEEYMDQVFGSTRSTLQTVSVAVIIIAVFLTVLITLLFMKMLVAKDRYQISVLKSLGYTAQSIRMQYFVRAGVVLLLGIAVGTIAANTLGELVGIALLSASGASVFHFNINWLFAYLLAPLVMTGCVYIATELGISRINTIKVSEYIKE